MCEFVKTVFLKNILQKKQTVGKLSFFFVFFCKKCKFLLKESLCDKLFFEKLLKCETVCRTL